MPYEYKISVYNSNDAWNRSDRPRCFYQLSLPFLLNVGDRCRVDGATVTILDRTIDFDTRTINIVVAP